MDGVMRPRSALVRFSRLVVLTYAAALPCGWGQNISEVFLTPVPNAPFTGVIVVERTMVGGDSPAGNLKTTRDVARDGQGRVYNIFRQLVPATESGPPPIVRIKYPRPADQELHLPLPREQGLFDGHGESSAGRGAR